MIIWQALATGGPITVDAWYGNNGTGLFDLFERHVGGPWTLMGTNPSVAQPLSLVVPGGEGMALFSLRTFAGTPAGGALAVFLEVKQSGQTLQALDSAGAPLNGNHPPFRNLHLQPPAPNAVVAFYPFEVFFQ